jgi:hypothetical protein
MEITRKTEIIVETIRQFVISRANLEEQIRCPQCAEIMITAEHCAAFLRTSRREIYRLIETGAAHFAETETGAVLVCTSSFGIVSDEKTKQADGSAAEEI